MEVYFVMLRKIYRGLPKLIGVRFLLAWTGTRTREGRVLYLIHRNTYLEAPPLNILQVSKTLNLNEIYGTYNILRQLSVVTDN